MPWHGPPHPTQECEARRLTPADATSLSPVQFDTNRYSVAVKYAHRTITVVATVDDGKRVYEERRLKAARFPQTKTLNEFDFGQQPFATEPLVLELVTWQYIDNRENALLIGSSGVGKTHLTTGPC